MSLDDLEEGPEDLLAPVRLAEHEIASWDPMLGFGKNEALRAREVESDRKVAARYHFNWETESWEERLKKEKREEAEKKDKRLQLRRRAHGWVDSPVVEHGRCAMCGEDAPNLSYALCGYCLNGLSPEARRPYRFDNGDVVRPPAWAEARSFDDAFSSARTKAVTGGKAQEGALKSLARAKVICVGREQVESLPNGFADSSLRLPFPTIYLDADGAQLSGLKDDPNQVSWRLAGALVTEAGQPQPEAGLTAHLFARTPTGSVEDLATVAIKEGACVVTEVQSVAPWFGDIWAQESGRLVLAVVSWLQSCNLEFVEVELSDDKRRKHLEAGKVIALTVQIKRPTRRQDDAGAPSGSARYSHAFDVAGHARHHFELTSEGRQSEKFRVWRERYPDRLIVVDGKPCFREWVSNYVKGEGAYVPKIRTSD